MDVKKWLTLLWICCIITANAQQNKAGVKLVKKDGYAQLLVKGQPFMVLGGETGNSSASDMKYMATDWARLRAMNLNTILAPVYWELMEPEENKFDFSLVDDLLSEARKADLKLVLLWFGTWKNSMSCYAPLWMKTNAARFPRTADNNKRSQEIFSVFGKETLQADKKAFAALMRHLRETDAQQQTVIMVQVENEIGMLTTAREISKTADGLFHAKIPTELMDYLKKNKDKLVPELRKKWEDNGARTNESWAKTFGEGLTTDELFQAWHYASFANEVTKAGKKEYDLPMFVNAALPRPGRLPGQYPSAGPLPHLMDIWQAAAPAIDFLSPDFYNPDTRYWCDLYVRNNNPLFVPEINFDNTCAGKAFFVIGHYKALGFSPFSIESERKPIIALKKSYDVLAQLAPVIHSGKYLGMDGFVFDKKNLQTTTTMGTYTINVSHDNTLGWSEEAKDSVWSSTGGIIIQTAADEFIVAGTGVVATFTYRDSSFVSNIATADEVIYKNNVEVKGRRMNGDQDHQGRHIRIPTGEWGIQKVKLYKSPATINN